MDIARKKKGKKGEIVLAYLGSMNHLIDIERIEEVITTLIPKYKVIVHVIGNGFAKEKFLTMLKQNGAMVKFHGELYDSKALVEIFCECDFGLNIYKPTTCIGMTMKSMDYFCYNLPIINSIPCDTERLIKKYNAGINIKEFSIEKMEAYQKQEKRIEALVEEELSKEVFQTRMNEVMEKLT